MKVYKCDCCGDMIDNPYSTKMVEFYIGSVYDNGCVFPINTKRKVKIDLCQNCWNGLSNIAKEKLNTECKINE